MKITQAILLSVLCTPFIITSATAKCPEGTITTPEHRCALPATVANPCKEGFFYSHKHKDCSRCDEGYTYSCKTQTCVKEPRKK